ncbi:hypothetical protein SEA_PUPPER_221 [Gordonia phage Pupper]|uniref:Uncharacterized protein n=1 Tax=Gordonia phage Pupper TaxID=2571249 RepID=A0A4Y6EKY5_9CAUD|nr:hypothetical protein KHQ83_gp056 [Gordonia phage Pupper]QDF18707.1 hypothetical protein SEA_PUPPER_221 [Gordonia phage Pupper]
MFAHPDDQLEDVARVIQANHPAEGRFWEDLTDEHRGQYFEIARELRDRGLLR